MNTNNNNNTAETETHEAAIHNFERAGLGKAPFRYLGHSREIYQAIPGAPDCPIQPGACCDYCGTAIMEVFHIADRTGRRFKVGSECVRHTGNAGIVRKVKAEVSRQRKIKNDARVDSQIAAAKAAWPFVVNALAQEPHSNAYRASRGDTLADYSSWIFDNAGRTGKAKAARAIFKTLKELTCP